MMNSPLSANLSLDGFDLASGIPGGGLAGKLAYRGKLSASAGKIDLDGSATLDALRLFPDAAVAPAPVRFARSEEQTSELQSLMRISYAVFCLNKRTTV